MNHFERKIALVTGAARGIGRGIALSLAQEGADLVINDYANIEEAAEVCKEISAIDRHALFLQADVSDRTAVEHMFDEAIKKFGRVDIVVANAGRYEVEPVLTANWESTLRTLEINQFGVFHTCQIAAQHMVKQAAEGISKGKIIIISSVHAELAVPNAAAYNMAKAAVTHLGKTMAVELAPYHINVNIIHPGSIDTPRTRSFVNEEIIQKGSKRIPWGRIGRPDDIGQAAVFLASSAADYITGATLRVDGGFVLGLRYPFED